MRKKATTRFRFDDQIGNANGSNSHFKGSPSSNLDMGNIKVVGKRKKRATAKITMKSEVCEGKVVLDLPLQTASEANRFEHWRVRHQRKQNQKEIVALGLIPLRDKIKLPCKIMLTRLAPDELDAFENLPMSFKYIVDAVCAIITGDYRPGRADGDKRISLACDQVKNKEYGVRIEITY